MPEVRVKICGITRHQDALAAVEAGVDALGFNFWPQSKRYIAVETAKPIIDALPPLVVTVGLFVNQSRAEIQGIASALGLQVLQLHGDEAPEDCLGYGAKVIKALAVTPALTPAALTRYQVSGFVLDTPSVGYGGSGKAFDWGLIDNLSLSAPLILSGGLNCANVAAAVARVHPYAVDVASGVETSPGVKDAALMRRFIVNAKQWA